MRELAELFPSQYIHIGGDEVNTAQWMRCPDCKALMAREGLKDGEALQAYFMNRLSKIVEKYGKRP
jgi:hexosaminidase